jgi:hypothetical protein
MISEAPEVFQKLGFTFDSESEESKNKIAHYKRVASTKNIRPDKINVEPTYCFITREKLLELYGKEVYQKPMENFEQ